MRLNFLVGLVLAFVTSLAVAVEAPSSLEVFVWPMSAAKSQTLARVSYNSTTATLVSYSAPKLVADDDTVRVGFYQPSGAWSGVVTSASNFAAGKDKSLSLLLNAENQVYHVGFQAIDKPVDAKTSKTKKSASKETDTLHVRIEKTATAPGPHLNKPVLLKADGTADEPEAEKTFFQKYWWMIAGFLVLQMVMSGTKE
ncbi:Hypothetical protein R9X50_00575000 [Acrodontium crateriforme]|uniref:Uncharacterized protein n=1 Tax=Acrodontium crateriforme TaxID=150365 RepID=A0AAQ3MCV5_9PEZI|nr:Hypothetical protein R9X50_00575000 [Acrodontium crateriforme]